MISRKGYLPGSKISNSVFVIINFILSIKILKKRIKRGNTEKTHFIIFRVGGFGDYILSLDFYNDLIEHYPDASFTFIGGPPLATLSFLFPAKVTLITSSLVNIKSLHVLFKLATYKELIRIKRSLQINGKKNVFICALRLETILGTLKCILFQKLSNPIETFGFNTAGRGAFYDNSIQDSGYLIKHERLYLEDLKKLILAKCTPISEVRQGIKRDSIWKNDIEEDDILKLVIHPGGGSNPNDIKWRNKRWDTINYIALIDELHKTHKIEIVLTGSKEEAIIAEEIKKGVNKEIPCMNLAGKTSIKDIYEILNKSHLYIGSDSGISHLAGYVNIPTVVMFAYSDHIGYAPVGSNVKILTSSLACAPCLYKFSKRECLNTNWEFKCKKDLSLDLVRKAVYEKLEEFYSAN